MQISEVYDMSDLFQQQEINSAWRFFVVKISFLVHVFDVC